MKTDTIIIQNEKELDDAIAALKNYGKLKIGSNFFSINKVTTILEAKLEQYVNDVLQPMKDHSFVFSYNDQSIKAKFKVVYPLMMPSCIEFIKMQKLLNESQIAQIEAKVAENLKPNEPSSNFYDNVNILNNIAYNEALLMLTKAINKDDYDETKADFDSKYEDYKKAIGKQHDSAPKFEYFQKALVDFKLNQDNKD